MMRIKWHLPSLCTWPWHTRSVSAGQRALCFSAPELPRGRSPWSALVSQWPAESQGRQWTQTRPGWDILQVPPCQGGLGAAPCLPPCVPATVCLFLSPQAQGKLQCTWLGLVTFLALMGRDSYPRERNSVLKGQAAQAHQSQVSLPPHKWEIVLGRV